MKQKVIIIGIGTQAKYISDIFGDKSDFKIIGFIKDNDDKDPYWISHYGASLYNNFDSIEQHNIQTRTCKFIVANSCNKSKERIVNKFSEYDIEFVNAVHSSSIIAPSAKIGTNSIINANAVIQPFAKIGSGVMIHSGVIVEHDNVIEDYVNLAPGVKLSGWVTVKKGAYLYTGANVIPGITIGEDAIVGAGSVVLENVPDNATVAGVPAKIIKRNQG